MKCYLFETTECLQGSPWPDSYVPTARNIKRKALALTFPPRVHRTAQSDTEMPGRRSGSGPDHPCSVGSRNGRRPTLLLHWAPALGSSVHTPSNHFWNGSFPYAYKHVYNTKTKRLLLILSIPLQFLSSMLLLFRGKTS